MAEGRYRYGDVSDSERRNRVKATVDIETIDDVDTDRAKRKFEAGEDLRPLELKALADTGVVSVELNE